ncbi:MAG TPA: response regulator, partial [Allocoleopsis sp.]
LGLTISRKFVQLMGGEISISSQVGKGTKISFDIQASEVEATFIESKPPTRRVIALEPNQPRYRILIVDDALDNRQVLIELLAPFGFELTEARNGLEAIERWEAWEPHLILMDMRMPVMGGFEATQQIRAKERERWADGEKSQFKPTTAIIALTASSLDEERTLILSAGCDDFIRKPFKEAEIFDAFHNHIGVRFVYEEPIATPSEIETQTELSIPTALASLPSDVVTNLYNALLDLDVELIQKAIAQIRSVNEPLADALATFANKFEYEQLLNLIPH